MIPPEAIERPISNFQEFIEDLPKSFIHIWHITDEFKGARDRRVQMEIRYSHTPNRKDHWIQMFYERSAFSIKEKDPMKICIINKIKQTTTDWEKMTPEAISHINDDQNIEIDSDIRYGKNCISDAQVHIMAEIINIIIKKRNLSGDLCSLMNYIYHFFRYRSTAKSSIHTATSKSNGLRNSRLASSRLPSAASRTHTCEHNSELIQSIILITISSSFPLPTYNDQYKD